MSDLYEEALSMIATSPKKNVGCAVGTALEAIPDEYRARFAALVDDLSVPMTGLVHAFDSIGHGLKYSQLRRHRGRLPNGSKSMGSCSCAV